jgi:hypothetical protein
MKKMRLLYTLFLLVFISNPTFAQLQGQAKIDSLLKELPIQFDCQHRGLIEAKGLGKIDMFYVERIKSNGKIIA